MRLNGIRLWALGFGIALSVASVQGSQNLAIKKINLPRIPEAVVASDNLPRRDAPLRIAALRVEFVRDTLSTTTGDGSFDYGYNDSNYFDPPPHDSLYFADHLEFQNFYWDKMSDGNLGFTWDIFPPGAQAAYQLPKQMWQYNHNNGAKQLDSGLVDLFHDAIVAADADPTIVWTNYDLVIIFHAGAGAEFDLGYTTTPHDLPSAWMVPEDFRSHGYPNGIPVDNGFNAINKGLILPETETHEGVQISMAGVISLMIGHWLGLPALYDRDDGKPVVGKWSMMDRGFGNFYGALPGPVDAWSASKMGWLDIEDAATGANRIQDRLHNYTALPEDPIYPGALRIPVSSQEEFILECRYRDPENDSVAYAWDRNGRRMTFHDDYSVTVEPGFRVPVRADDLDFDSPGSGILIWHHDAGLDRLIAEGRFNSVDEVRGLDLEEADGAQDIGRDYPLLTPGYGTDYGIFEDAWYGDNDGYDLANQGRAVSFNNDSYPNSRSNSGAFTHVKVDSISRRGWQMGFRYKKQGELFSLAQDGYNGGSVVIGNFDDDITSQEMMIFSPRRVRVYDLTGHFLDEIGLGSSSGPQGDNILVRDINNDNRDDLVWVGNGDLVGMISEPNSRWMFIIWQNYDSNLPLIGWGGSSNTSVLIAITTLNDTTYVRRYNTNLEELSSHLLTVEPGYPISLHRLGSTDSDSFLVITDPFSSLVLSTASGLTILRSQPFHIDETNDIFPYPIGVADFDGSGLQDVLIGGGEGVFTWTVCKDILSVSPPDPIVKYIDDFDFDPEPPFDVNRDGLFDLIGTRGFAYQDLNRQSDIAAFTLDGVILENYPRAIVQSSGLNPTSRMDYGTLDFHSDGRLVVRSLANRIENGSYKHYLDCGFDDGSSLAGFPIATDGWPSSIRFAEIDTIGGYDLIVAFNDKVVAYSLPTSSYRNQSIWWQGRYRDNDHSNAIWEPATPFVAAPGAKLLEDNLCYNWPNPARGETTAIRYTLNFPATVSVEIFDIAGDKVATLSGNGEAGLPNEIVWDLRDVARGAYLAVVEATGNGKTERKTVKIAVVK